MISLRRTAILASLSLAPVLMGAPLAEAAVLYTTDFASSPFVGLPATITSPNDVPAGSWAGAQHGVTHNQFGWFFNTTFGRGEIFYSPLARAEITAFAGGLSIPDANVTTIVAEAADKPGNQPDQLALFIDNVWYLSQQKIDSTTGGIVTETFNVAGALFAPAVTDGFTAKYPGPGTGDPNNLVFGPLPAGTITAAGLFNGFTGPTGTGGQLNYFSYTINGSTAVPEPGTIGLLGTALAGFLGLGWRRRPRAS